MDDAGTSAAYDLDDDEAVGSDQDKEVAYPFHPCEAEEDNGRDADTECQDIFHPLVALEAALGKEVDVTANYHVRAAANLFPLIANSAA